MSRTAALSAIVFLCLASASRAEMLPSFHVSGAAKAASSVVVVEDGKVSEVWAGDVKVGTPWSKVVKPASVKVVYGFRGYPEGLVNQELAKKGLKRVGAVSGKRMVYFVLPEPYQGIAQMMSRDPAYTTAWLEDGQAFAIQQWMNPGPADMRSLDMTEAELKQAVLEVRSVDAKLRDIHKEEDRAERAKELLALLKPESHLWNNEVEQSIRQCGKAAWPVIEAALSDDEMLPLHGRLLYLAHELARQDARPLFTKVLTAERAYFERLDAAGEKYDRLKPPHLYHERRRSAAQWALDSSR